MRMGEGVEVGWVGGTVFGAGFVVGGEGAVRGERGRGMVEVRSVLGEEDDGVEERGMGRVAGREAGGGGGGVVRGGEGGGDLPVADTGGDVVVATRGAIPDEGFNGGRAGADVAGAELEDDEDTGRT